MRPNQRLWRLLRKHQLPPQPFLRLLRSSRPPRKLPLPCLRPLPCPHLLRPLRFQPLSFRLHPKPLQP